jgi:hypothetical protein
MHIGEIPCEREKTTGKKKAASIIRPVIKKTGAIITPVYYGNYRKNNTETTRPQFVHAFHPPSSLALFPGLPIPFFP